MDIELHFPVIQWSMANNNYFDDFEVYKDSGFVVVSTTGRNHAKMVTLTHCGLVTPYGDRDLGQNWPR